MYTRCGTAGSVHRPLGSPTDSYPDVCRAHADVCSSSDGCARGVLYCTSSGQHIAVAGSREPIDCHVALPSLHAVVSRLQRQLNQTKSKDCLAASLRHLHVMWRALVHRAERAVQQACDASCSASGCGAPWARVDGRHARGIEVRNPLPIVCVDAYVTIWHRLCTCGSKTAAACVFCSTHICQPMMRHLYLLNLEGGACVILST